MEPGQGRIREGEFREWFFPIKEVLEWIRLFLRDSGYEVLPSKPVGLVTPDIHATRKDGPRTYEIVVLGAQHTNVALDALTKLSALRASLGDKVDYVLVLPPISEYLMLEFLREGNGRWYFAMKQLKMMMWLANPDEEFTWCLIGEPQDRVFRGTFAAGKMGVDFLLNREFGQNRWSEED